MLTQPQMPIDIQDQSSSEADAALRTEFEAVLRAILHLAPDAPIGSRSPGDLGLTSLGAITLQYKLQADWSVELSVGEILEAETVDTLFSLAIARRAACQQEGIVI